MPEDQNSDPSDPLKTYREKRDFSLTTEPAGGGAVGDAVEDPDPGKGIFVVQKHLSRRLHYDLRLEVDGVLKSWAIPKGPSSDPSDKRLAVQTEDHPLEYASFSGRIPEGQYGAGTVVIWDSGSYRNMTHKDGREVSMADALEKGHASFWLEGRRLQGGYALTRTQRGWIMVKMRDGMARPGSLPAGEK